jgi:hypothetical protein
VTRHSDAWTPELRCLGSAVSKYLFAGQRATEDLHPKQTLREKRGAFVKIIGVVLIIAGVAALIYGGFSFTTQKKAVDMGPVQIDKTEHHSVPLPPLLGVVAIIGGGALFYFGAKEGK